jgi:hypothetical protein
MMKRFVLFILSLVCIGLMSCGGSPTAAPPPAQIPATIAPTTAPTNTPAKIDSPFSTPTAAATNLEPPSGDPFEFVKSAVLAQLQAKNFRATSKTHWGNGAQSQTVVEYIAPDRVHAIFPTGQEQIAIRGKGAWVKTTVDWQVAPPEAEADMLATFTPEALEAILALAKQETVRYVGIEQLNGKPMFTYTYDLKVDANDTTTARADTTVWIDVRDRRQTQVQSRAYSNTQAGVQSIVTATYEYDIPLTIEPPSIASTDLRPPAGDPFEFLNKARLAPSQAKSYRKVTNIEGGDGQTRYGLVEYVAPDRLHLILGSEELIGIKGKGAWVKQAESWVRASPEIEAALFSVSPTGAPDESFASIKRDTVLFIGVQQLNGSPMFVYIYESEIDTGSGTKRPAKAKVWISALDHRVYQTQIVTDSLVKKGTKDKATTTMEYDIPMTIEAPQ